jgi:prevent-host-death family protein
LKISTSQDDDRQLVRMAAVTGVTGGWRTSWKLRSPRRIEPAGAVVALPILTGGRMIRTAGSNTEIAMAQTTIVEFQRKLGEFQLTAQREPVEITRRGRRELVLMSAEHYDWLTAAARRTYRTEDAASVVVDAVRRADMDPELAHLDGLMK